MDGQNNSFELDYTYVDRLDQYGREIKSGTFFSVERLGGREIQLSIERYNPMFDNRGFPDSAWIDLNLEEMKQLRDYLNNCIKEGEE